MPEVTVPDSQSGAPIATTGWPTFTDDDEPSEITVSSREVCTWSTARSVWGSAGDRRRGGLPIGEQHHHRTAAGRGHRDDVIVGQYVGTRPDDLA